nr:AarF/UbiB family protein [Endozoicomonas sp.]
AEGVNIHHIKVLGRGTIAQIDHVRINDKDYAVKTLSPRLVWAMKSDAGLARGALLLAKCWGKISETDLDALSRDIEKIIQETDLSIELQNTRRQTDIFNKPSTDGGYHLEFYREVNMKECFTVPVKFKVPRVYPDLSSTNSLVMEIIDGFSLDRNEEINNMLLSWKPDWNDNKPFTPPQIAMFTYSVKSLVMEVYLEAARENEFINADFQLGNFMMKLEENKVVVYCIDHGHCISVRSPSPTAKSLHYALIKTLVNFFHSRCRIAEDIARDAVGSGDVSMNPLALIEELAGHEQQDGKAEAIHVTLKSKEAVRIRELTYSPLSYNDIQHIESTIENYEILGKNFIPSVDDDIEWCKSTRSVEEVCHKLYDWLKSDWVQSERSGNERAFPCKDDFVNRLIPTLFKVAFELKEFDKLDFETQFERSGIPFDDFVHGMGLSFPGGDLALVRLTLLVEEFNYARLKLAFG